MEKTDSASKRWSNSTRARFARDGGRDLVLPPAGRSGRLRVEFTTRMNVDPFSQLAPLLRFGDPLSPWSPDLEPGRIRARYCDVSGLEITSS
jgi:hypothetical protein